MRDLVTYQLARLVAAAPELDPNVIIASSLTLVGVLGAAIIANRLSRSRPKPTSTPAPSVPPSPLAQFSGTQNEFMKLVIRDNELIRADLAAVRAEVAEVKEALEEERADRSTFERAVRRYLELLASVWPGPDPMPWPANGDEVLLDRALPRRPRRPRSN